MFEHASKTSQTNKNFSFGFSERLARREVDLMFGLVKRSGRPEQWPNWVKNTITFVKFGRFLGHLERFGEIWIPIWINC